MMVLVSAADRGGLENRLQSPVDHNTSPRRKGLLRKGLITCK